MAEPNIVFSFIKGLNTQVPKFNKSSFASSPVATNDMYDLHSL